MPAADLLIEFSLFFSFIMKLYLRLNLFMFYTMKLSRVKFVIILFSLAISGCVATNSPQRKAIKDLQKGRIIEDTSYIYDLPFEKGTAHLVVQGYYSAYSHKNRAAIDFKMKK